MLNLKLLEKFRTKEEILSCLKQFGKNITEEELDTLKKNYKQTEENNTILNMQQLKDIAGGALIFAKRSTKSTNKMVIDYPGNFNVIFDANGIGTVIQIVDGRSHPVGYNPDDNSLELDSKNPLTVRITDIPDQVLIKQPGEIFPFSYQHNPQNCDLIFILNDQDDIHSTEGIIYSAHKSCNSITDALYYGKVMGFVEKLL